MSEWQIFGTLETCALCVGSSSKQFRLEDHDLQITVFACNSICAELFRNEYQGWGCV